jgi:hypothetical protein
LRIKKEGPRLDDLTLKHTVQAPYEPEGPVVDQEYKWIPDDVITAGGAYLLSEPRWADLPQMSIMELFHVRRTCCAHALTLPYPQWRPAMRSRQLHGQARERASLRPVQRVRSPPGLRERNWTSPYYNSRAELFGQV